MDGHEVTVVHNRGRGTALRLANAPLTRRVRSMFGWLRDVVDPVRPDWFGLRGDVEIRFVDGINARSLPPADVCVATAWWTADVIARLPRSRGAPLHLIQGYETWSASPSAVHASWRLPIQKAAVAQWLLRRAHEIGVPLDLITYVPIAVETDDLELSSSAERDRFKVATQYHTSRNKGADVALEAISLARKRIPAVSANVFGTTRRPSLPAWAEYVRAPSRRALARLYQQSSVYICGSWSEGWHLPPAEAAVCGCAIVSTAIDGVREYVTPEASGLLAPPGDVEGLADQLTRVLLDDELRLRLAERASATIRTYTWERTLASFYRACATAQ